MHPSTKEMAAIYAYYKKTFAFDDNGTIDYYFQHIVKKENCFVFRKDNQIVSLLFAHPHTMHIQRHTLPILFISGVITKETERNKGYMKALFEQLFDNCGNTALYALQAYHADIYTSLGFCECYFHKWIQDTVPSFHNEDEVVPITDAKELVECAAHCLSAYDGWLDHDEAFYQFFIGEARAQKHHIVGLYQKGQLQAFARYAKNKDTLTIEELLSRTLEAKQRLLSALHKQAKHIMRPIPCTKAEPKRACNLMIRLGNTTLCSACLDRSVNQLADIFTDDMQLYHYGWW